MLNIRSVLLVSLVSLIAVPGMAQTPHLTGEFNAWSTQSTGANPLPMLDDGVAPDETAMDGIFTVEVTFTNPSPGTEFTQDYKVLPSGEFGADELGLFNPSGTPDNFRLFFPGSVTTQDVVFTYDARDFSPWGWAPASHFSDDWTIGYNHDGSPRTWVAVGNIQSLLGDTDWNPASTTTVLLDDGTGGDRVAGDGVYSLGFIATSDTQDLVWKVVNQQADFTNSTKLCPQGWVMDGIGAGGPAGELFSIQTGQTVWLNFHAQGGRMMADVHGPVLPVLLNEVVASPTAGEFVEIYNPSPFAVSLTGYYLSDRDDYYLVVQQDNSSENDFIVRFPDGTLIAADSILTVALDGAEFFNTYGVNADFEILATDVGVADMVEEWAGAVGGSVGLTDETETMVLFYWDGSSDLVTDSDYVFWGTPTPTNKAVDKTGETVGSSTYQDDTAAANQSGPTEPVTDESIVRIDVDEGTEVRGQGNGFWGHDETSENLNVTWAVAGAPGPGCPAGQGLCSAACIDIWADTANCGACANACQGGENCCTGVCSDPQTDEAHCGDCTTACSTGEGCCGGSCIDVSSDPANCGDCGNICPMGNNCCSGICSDPTNDEANCNGCGNACDVGQGCCSSACIDVMSDTSNCGDCGVTCNAGDNCCSGSCSDPLTDEAHCGNCTTACNVGEECADGICCPAGQSNCSGACADLQTDPNHCGNCTTVCAGGQVCSAGVCTDECGAGLTKCGASCVDLQTDANHCGACDNACTYANAQGVCSSGVCGLGACDNLWGNCDGIDFNGCEYNLSDDLNNCGACGNVCSFDNASASCDTGVCTMGACDAGYDDCDTNPATGCEADLSSPGTCGACDNTCSYDHASAVCNQGICGIGACDTGWGNCDGNDANGCETDVRENVNHCGACNSPCQAGEACVAGGCTTECPGGQTKCEDVCVDLQTNAQHCGTCGHSCNSGEECRGGACTLPTYSISGRVLNKASGEGLSGVILTLDSEREAGSASDGFYIFVYVPAGHHTIVAEADGFQTETIEVPVADANVERDIELTPKAERGCSCSSGTSSEGTLWLLLLLISLTVLRRKAI